MDKKLSVLNFILIVAISVLLFWNVSIWLAPKYQSRVDGSTLNTTAKILQNYDIKRKGYPASIVPSINSGNLFRQERQGYSEEPAAISKTNQIPLPEFKVKGIMIIASSKIAVLEGKYFLSSGQSETLQKPIKKKGYRIGDYIGNYRIQDIDKTSVTLSDDAGKSTTPIEKQGTNFRYKPPKATKKEQKKQDEKPQTVQMQTVQKSRPNKQPLTSPAPVPQISGRPQYQGRMNVSGANISGNRTPTIRPRISGR